MNYREISLDNPDYLHMHCRGPWDVESSKEAIDWLMAEAQPN